MGLQLVIGEQALAVERADDIVDGVLQQHDALALIGRARQHVIEEQHLAQRRRHFGDENRVVGVHERLMGLRQHRVHRVPHLVRQREHRIERVVVVQQHVRMHAVHRRRIRAAALAGVFVHVDPAPVERLPDAPLIVRRRAASSTRRSRRSLSSTGTCDRSRSAERAGRTHGRSRGRAPVCAGGDIAAAARCRPSPSPRDSRRPPAECRCREAPPRACS